MPDDTSRSRITTFGKGAARGSSDFSPGGPDSLRHFSLPRQFADNGEEYRFRIHCLQVFLEEFQQMAVEDGYAFARSHLTTMREMNERFLCRLEQAIKENKL